MTKIDIKLPPVVKEAIQALNESVVFGKQNYTIADAWIVNNGSMARCLINFGAIMSDVRSNGIIYFRLTETGKQLYIVLQETKEVTAHK